MARRWRRSWFFPPSRFVVLLACALGCSSGSGADGRPHNLLLISIDSLRADHLGCYGYARETSPTLDRLAASGVRFADVQSPTSWTLPSHVTLLTGLSQESHGTVSHLDRISAAHELLQEVFARRGFETIGLFSGPFLDPTFGFSRGFAAYVSCQSEEAKKLGPRGLKLSHEDRTNPLIQAEFARWIARRGRSAPPFFAFVHMWDVHYDYIPPEPYASMFDPDYTGPLDGRHIFGKGFPLDAPPRDVEHLKALYDGEIRYTDATIGILLDTLDKAGLLEDTLVAVTSDHGEEFLEHGGKTHERTLFREVVHVPLILWARSGLPRGKVVSPPVALQDVAPTLLDLMHLDGLAKADGRSLVPLIKGEAAPASVQFSALYSASALYLASARQDAREIIYDSSADRWDAYDLSSDPGEKSPRAADDGPLKTALQSNIERAQALIARRESSTQDAQAISPPIVEKLRKLGYLAPN